MHSISCPLLKKTVHVAFFQTSIIHPKNIRIIFNEKLSPFLDEYLSSEICSLQVFNIFYIKEEDFKILLTIFLWVNTCLSQIPSHFFHVLFVPMCGYNTVQVVSKAKLEGEYIHMYIYTYRIEHYNHSVSITLKFLTPMMCVNFIPQWRGIYSLKSTLNDRFLRNYFMINLFHLPEFLTKSLLRGIVFDV